MAELARLQDKIEPFSCEVCVMVCAHVVMSAGI